MEHQVLPEHPSDDSTGDEGAAHPRAFGVGDEGDILARDARLVEGGLDEGEEMLLVVHGRLAGEEAGPGGGDEGVSWVGEDGPVLLDDAYSNFIGTSFDTFTKGGNERGGGGVRKEAVVSGVGSVEPGKRNQI